MDEEDEVGAISLHVDTCTDDEHNLLNTLEMLEKEGYRY